MPYDRVPDAFPVLRWAIVPDELSVCVGSRILDARAAQDRGGRSARERAHAPHAEALRL